MCIFQYIVNYLEEGLEALMKMIRSDNPDIKEAATLALSNLTSSNSHNCRQVKLVQINVQL